MILHAKGKLTTLSTLIHFYILFLNHEKTDEKFLSKTFQKSLCEIFFWPKISLEGLFLQHKLIFSVKKSNICIDVFLSFFTIFSNISFNFFFMIFSMLKNAMKKLVFFRSYI